jgi:ferredoxin-NADP reductase
MNLLLEVTGVRAEALDIISVELRDAMGRQLPPFEPGAHLQIELLNPREGLSFVRQYSICSDNRDRDRYVIAVARPPSSRGGSAAFHDFVRVGTSLKTGEPRNNFPLVADAGFYHFVAGGIGITPILGMIRWCIAHGKQWSLLYCARSKLRAAFYETLLSLGGDVRFHFDDECVPPIPDLTSEFADPVAREHVYCCGPAPLMQAVRDICADRNPDNVHFEWFSADASIVTSEPAGEFEIILEQSGIRLPVPEGRSILEVLEENGVTIASACREGVCGSCETAVISGQIDHRDHVLSKAERASNGTMMVCVSRAAGGTLTLDV